ncbi:hypothetical protein L2K20_27430 [Mycobacterium sp. MBM]|nr:hypothetical protein [Mycobacterium sp. MBM]
MGATALETVRTILGYPTQLPAGADVASFGAAALSWPMMLITGPVEEHCDVG